MTILGNAKSPIFKKQNVQVLRQDGDKEMLEMEALSLVILELNFTDSRTESVQVNN